jgi:hypothetical protein
MITVKLTCRTDNGEQLQLTIRCGITNLSDYDLIIGRPDIKRFSLLTKLADQILTCSSVNCAISAPTHEEAIILQLHQLTMREFFEVGDADDADEGMFDTDDPLLSTESLLNYPVSPSDEDLPTNICKENPQFYEQILNICRKYRAVFSRKVRKTPAQVEPLLLQVDDDGWKKSQTQEDRRYMNAQKMASLDEHLKSLLTLDCIESAQTPNYSHVLMVPKGSNWRLCIDYRRLNKFVEDMGRRVPRALEIFTRLGQLRPKVFGYLDMTSGYHQIEIHENSRKYTAFTTHTGVYQWKRMPMGLKTSGCHFQEQMFRVLREMLNTEAELYMDDVLVHSVTDNDFLLRLLQLLLNKGVTIHPDKCKLGFSRIEYLGYEVTENGYSFTSEQKASTLECHISTNYGRTPIIHRISKLVFLPH